MGWNGLKNGALLKLLPDNDFEGMISFVSGLPYQHDCRDDPLPVLILGSKSTVGNCWASIWQQLMLVWKV
jgi:hypothetical protein